MSIPTSAFDEADLLFEAGFQATASDDDEISTRMAAEAAEEEGREPNYEDDEQGGPEGPETDDEDEDEETIHALKALVRFTSVVGDFFRDWLAEVVSEPRLPQSFAEDLEFARDRVPEIEGPARGDLINILRGPRNAELATRRADAIQRAEWAVDRLENLLRRVSREILPTITKHIGTQIEEHKAAALAESRRFFRDFPQILAATGGSERSARMWFLGCGLAGAEPYGGILALRRSWAQLRMVQAWRSKGKMWLKKAGDFERATLV